MKTRAALYMKPSADVMQNTVNCYISLQYLHSKRTEMVSEENKLKAE